MKHFLYLLFVLPAFLGAQALGLHPPKVDWQQIDTDLVRVIFPEGYERQAQRVAKLVHRLQADHRRSIGEQYFKFDLVLQTENITPNAYVGLAPFRSELYTVPPQSFNLLGLTDWNDLLTIHEFRHVQQNSNERRGLTKLASYLQGQYGWAVLSGIATPNWFSEGDAVVMETALTSSGRGRLPAFTRELRMMELQGIRYSYAKSRNGSFKDFVPDHYRYGYLQNVYTRRQFGNDVWKEVLAGGAAYRSPFYSFSSALKKRTGLSTPQLYDQTLDAWKRDELLPKAEQANGQTEVLSPYHREPAQYRFPHPQPDGSIIALRSTYSRTPELVRVFPDRSVEVLTQVGFQREPYLDVQGNLAVWNETSQHPRYQNESYSDVVLYGIDSGTKRKLTRKGHFLSPSLSADGKKIVAAVYHPTEGAALAVMDSRENPVVTTHAASAIAYYAWPVFSPDGQTVYAFNRQNSQLAIIRQSLTGDRATEMLTPFTDEVKDNLTSGPAGKLYYSAPLDGTDQVFRFDPENKEIHQLTAVLSGAYQPGVGADGRLVYATASPSGLELARNASDFREKLYTPVPEIKTAPGYAEEAYNVLAQPFDTADFPVRNFSNYLGGVKLHSWSYNGNYVNPGLLVEATNALNTLSFAADVTYNYNEQRTGGGFTLGYGALFPVLELSGRYTERSVLVGDPAFVDSLAVNRTDFNQLGLTASAYLPLRWLSGNFFVDLVPRIGFTRLQLSNRNRLDERLPDAFNSIGGRLQFRVLERTALRQVQPRLGLSLGLRADDVLGGGDDRGGSLLLRSQAYLPGLLRDHGIRIDLDLQSERLLNAYQYPDRMQYARGFYAPLNDQAYRLGFNYQLPLFYPDFGIAGITYFKRIRVNAFFDTGSFGLDFIEAKFPMRSSGAEVFFDNRWLNAQDITVGLQGAYRLTRDFFAPAGESDLRWRVLVEGSF